MERSAAVHRLGSSSEKNRKYILTGAMEAVFPRDCDWVANFYRCESTAALISYRASARPGYYLHKYWQPFDRGTFVFTTLRAVSPIAPFVQVQRSPPGFETRFIVVVFELAGSSIESTLDTILLPSSSRRSLGGGRGNLSH